jgi:hypothetical protein
VVTRKEILDSAIQLTTADRQEQYGPPERNYAVTAQLWNAYAGTNLTPSDVCVMMALLKIGRIATGQSKDDNYVDCCGYIALAGEIRKEGQ